MPITGSLKERILLGIEKNIINAFVKLRRWKEAEKAFNGALEYDDDSTQAYQGLAEAYIGQRKYYEAAEAALTSVGLIYYQPMAHLLLGQALIFLKEYDRAEEALHIYRPATHRRRKQPQRLLRTPSRKTPCTRQIVGQRHSK